MDEDDWGSVDPAEGARLADALRELLLGDRADDVGPHVRAYVEDALDRLATDGAVTFEAGPLHEALVADSPEVTRLDDHRTADE